MQEILTAMQGITYLEWNKLKHTIERNFERRATTQNNKIQMDSPEELIASYKRLF